MKNAKNLCAFACAFACINSSYALQVIDPVEGYNSFVKISAKETTRIAVENGTLDALIVSEEELVVMKDPDRGQMFIRPKLLNKPINIRLITTAGSTYSVVLQPVDIPQEDIIIRDPASKKLDRDGIKDQKASNHGAAIRALVTQMANPEPSSMGDVKQVNQEIALWENTKFVLTEIYNARGYVGEKYRLLNTGKERLRMVEQELYRKGVVAVAIEKLTLDPGQATNVYVILEGR